MVASVPLLPLLILGFLTQEDKESALLCVLLARHGRWLIGGGEGTREMFREVASGKHLNCLYSVWEFC